MAHEWNARCADCGEWFGYSEATQQANEVRALPLPRQCPRCVKEFLRERRTLPRIAAELAAADAAAGGALGRVSGQSVAQYEHVEQGSILAAARSEFGLQDAQLDDFCRQMDNPATQVMIVVAPTGAGKSTFFPYRLLVPPRGWPRDMFTRGGQIVVTQPRIQATRNIPSYVSLLHGCRVGAGYDIGFRHAAEHACNARNRLVYVTDGTLINWIASGQLASVGLIMLDEAHERSLNIDLILGLITKVLPRYPRLKLVIASATIDEDKFRRFFATHLRGGARCGYVRFDGKPGKPVRKHFRCGHVQWEDAQGNVHREPDDPAAETLPYQDGASRELLASLPEQVAAKCLELLGRMYPLDGSLDDPLAHRRGDILAFLQGKKPIEQAVELIRSGVAAHPRLKHMVDVLPLHTELPRAEQDRALRDPAKVVRRIGGKDVASKSMCFRLREDFGPGENILVSGPDGVVARRRVIVSTNVAETSLTIHGILHVVETGIINQNTWDSATETAAVRQFIHSRAGCRQRWGRAGRVSEGDAWCLYTRAQFEAFPADTPPSILRSRLEPVVLAAKMAGLDSLDAESFSWIDPPSRAELERAVKRLRQQHALDACGDITPHGVEIFRLGAGDPRLANLTIMADRFGCAVEMATVLPILEQGGRTRLLLRSESNEDALRAIHDALTGACRDDLELYLKVFAAWTEAREGGPAVTANWAWKEIWGKALRARPMPEAARATLAPAVLAEVELALAAVGSADDLQTRVAPLAPPELHSFTDWVASLLPEFASAAAETWARLWGVNDALLRQVEKRRNETIDSLAVRKKEQERRTIHFERLDRLRLLLLWCNPDQCYLKTTETFKGEPLYEAAVEDESILPERILPSWVEEDEGAEPEVEVPSYRVEISDRSQCQGRKPDAFVGFGRKLRNTGKPHPNAKAIDLVNLAFVALVERRWVDQVRGASPARLGLLMSRIVLDAETASAEEGPVRSRLFLDQRYPVFSQWSCLPAQAPAESLRMDIGSSLRFWPESSALDIPGTGRDEEADDENVASRELSANIHVDLIEPPRVDDASMARPDDVDDSDDDGSAGDEVPSNDADGVGNETRSAAPAAPTPEPRRIPALLHLQPGQALPQGPLCAEVVGYAGRDTDAPVVILEWPTVQVRFDLFCSRFQAGDVVEVRVKEHRQVPQSMVIGLLVEEPVSGLTMEVLPEDLAFHYAAALAESVKLGSTLRLTVADIEPRRCRVRLSALPMLEPIMDEALKAGLVDRLQSARVFDSGERYVRLLLDPPAAGAGWALLTAELFQREGKVPMRCPVGSACHVRVDLRRDAEVPLSEPPDDFDVLAEKLARLSGGRCSWSAGEKKLRWQIQQWNPQRRMTETRMMQWTELRQALAWSPHARYRAALERLYRQTRQARAWAADPLLEARYPAGMRVRGRLLRRGEPGSERVRPSDGSLMLESGFWASVLADDFVEQIAEGALYPATVLESDAEQQRIRVTLRQDETEISLAQLRRVASQVGLLTRGRSNLPRKAAPRAQRGHRR